MPGWPIASNKVDSTEADQIAAARQGDEAAFEKLVAAHQGRLRVPGDLGRPDRPRRLAGRWLVARIR